MRSPAFFSTLANLFGLRAVWIAIMAPTVVACFIFIAGLYVRADSGLIGAKPTDLEEQNRAAQTTQLDTSPANPKAESIEDLVAEANKLRQGKRFREAEVTSQRAVRIDDVNLAAWRSRAASQRDMAEELLTKKRLLEAGQRLGRARASLNKIIEVSTNPAAAKTDPRIVIDEEAAVDAVAAKVQQAIDEDCGQHIEHAIVCADDAYHSAWNVLAFGFRRVKNDRDKVVEGLTELKRVFQLGRWASECIRTKCNVAFSNLKKLVNEDEWNDLLIRAGFDPVSRDTSKKWGAE